MENKHPKILAVITARAGSKGVVGKNYRNICGKPLFLWSVLAALESKSIDLIAISSNCPIIKSKSIPYLEKYSSRLIWIQRPDEYCDDLSISEHALEHAYNYACLNHNYNADYVALLQPTSPIRKKSLIDEAVSVVRKYSSCSLLTVSKHTPFFIQKKDDSVFWHYNRLDRPMRQSIPDDHFYYHDDGCLYLTSKDVLLNEQCRLSSNPYLFLNDEYSSMQVDSEEGFVIIESVMKRILMSGLYVS